MPDLIIDRRDVGGAFSVEENARLLMHYRYAEREMMRTEAGWPATVGDIKVKLGLHTHAYHCSTHADSLGKRLPELRVRGGHGPYPERTVDRFEPPTEAFVKFIEMLQDQEDPLLRIAGLYRVLKPHIVANYPLPHRRHRPDQRRADDPRTQVHPDRRGGASLVGPGHLRGAGADAGAAARGRPVAGRARARPPRQRRRRRKPPRAALLATTSVALKIDREACVNCSLCRRACPTDTIHYYDTPDLVHTIYAEGCIDCNKCVPVCPADCIHPDPDYVHDPAELEAAKTKAREWARRRRQGTLKPLEAALPEPLGTVDLDRGDDGGTIARVRPGVEGVVPPRSRGRLRAPSPTRPRRARTRTGPWRCRRRRRSGRRASPSSDRARTRR